MPRNGRGERHCKPFFTCHCEPKAWQSRPSSIVIASRRRGNPGPPLLSLRAEGVAIPALLYCHCEPKARQSRPSSIVIASRRRGNPGPPLLSLRAEGVAIPALLYCHCEPKAWQSRPSSIVIASRRRGNLGGVRLLRRPSSDGLPRNDKEVCHCGELKPRAQRRGQARQSHNSSYRSRHSLFMPLTNSTFLCLGPAFSCFSLEIALCTSSQTS